LGSDRAAGDPFPNHKTAAGLLAALPARAAVGARVLLDDLARLGTAARAWAELDPLGAELLLVERLDLADDLAGERLDLLHEASAVAAAVLDLGELVLPFAGELGGRYLVLLELGQLRVLGFVRTGGTSRFPRDPLSWSASADRPLRGRVVGLQSVDAAPAGLESDLAARAEALALDLGDDRRARVARRRMED